MAVPGCWPCGSAVTPNQISRGSPGPVPFEKAVISASALFWLGDASDDGAETRAFIDRRIDGVMRIEGAKARLKKLPGAQAVTDLAFGWIRAPRPRDLPGRTRP